MHFHSVKQRSQANVFNEYRKLLQNLISWRDTGETFCKTRLRFNPNPCSSFIYFLFYREMKMKEETEIEYGKVEKLQPLFLESLEIYLKIRANSSSR